MEFSDFIKIFFCAAVRFGANWLQSRLQPNKDKLKIHREKVGDILDILITYFTIVLICFPLQFLPRVTDWLTVISLRFLIDL